MLQWQSNEFFQDHYLKTMINSPWRLLFVLSFFQDHYTMSTVDSFQDLICGTKCIDVIGFFQDHTLCK